MSRLFIFNCSNDMALASGANEYVPPKSVARMEEVYARIPLFVADEGDVALGPKDLAVHNGFSELCGIMDSPITEICPWGWSKPLCNKLLRFGVPKTMLPDEFRLDLLRTLSSREFGVVYAESYYSDRLVERIETMLVKNCMRYVRSVDGIQFGNGTYIAKIPWSSSGRGNRVFNYMQGGECLLTKFPVLIDVYYNKVLDFAMEFDIGADAVEYLGLSVFKADGNGRYEFNYVESQADLEGRVRHAMGLSREDAERLLSEIREVHLAILGREVVGRYKGPLGIDMMVVDDCGVIKIHPVVELNLRMNMGIMALKAYQKYDDRFPVLTLEGMIQEKPSYPRFGTCTFSRDH